MDIITLQANEFKSPSPLSVISCKITPEIAQQMLLNNTDNIPPNTGKIRTYVGEMSSGKWLLNGDSIRFDKEGILLDGQNRLMACIEANTSFDTAVVAGLESAVFNTIDQGRTRTKANLIARLYNSEITRTESMALSVAIPKIIYHDAGLSAGSLSSHGTKLVRPTVDEIDNWIKETPSIIEDCKYVFARIGMKGIMPKADCLFLLHIGKRYNKEYAEKVFSKLYLGVDIEEGETIFMLRELIIQIKTGQSKMSRGELHNTIIKVWNSVGAKGKFSIKHHRNIRMKAGEKTPFMVAPKENCIEQMLDK